MKSDMKAWGINLAIVLLAIFIFFVVLKGHAYAAVATNGSAVATSSSSTATASVDVVITSPDASIATLCATFTSLTGAEVPGVSGSSIGQFTRIGSYNYTGNAVLAFYYAALTGNETVTATTSAAGPYQLVCQPLNGLESPWFEDFGTGLQTATTSGSITLTRSTADSVPIVFARILNATTTPGAELTSLYQFIFPTSSGGANLMWGAAGTVSPETYTFTTSAAGNIGSVGIFAVAAAEPPPEPFDFTAGATSSVDQTQENLSTALFLFLFSMFGTIWLMRKH